MPVVSNRLLITISLEGKQTGWSDVVGGILEKRRILYSPHDLALTHTVTHMRKKADGDNGRESVKDHVPL